MFNYQREQNVILQFTTFWKIKYMCSVFFIFLVAKFFMNRNCFLFQIIIMWLWRRVQNSNWIRISGSITLTYQSIYFTDNIILGGSIMTRNLYVSMISSETLRMRSSYLPLEKHASVMLEIQCPILPPGKTCTMEFHYLARSKIQQ